MDVPTEVINRNRTRAEYGRTYSISNDDKNGNGMEGKDENGTVERIMGLYECNGRIRQQWMGIPGMKDVSKSPHMGGVALRDRSICENKS